MHLLQLCLLVIFHSRVINAQLVMPHSSNLTDVALSAITTTENVTPMPAELHPSVTSTTSSDPSISSSEPLPPTTITLVSITDASSSSSTSTSTLPPQSQSNNTHVTTTSTQSLNATTSTIFTTEKESISPKTTNTNTVRPTSTFTSVVTAESNLSTTTMMSGDNIATASPSLAGSSGARRISVCGGLVCTLVIMYTTIAIAMAITIASWDLV